MADEEIFDQTDEDDFDLEDLTPYEDVAEEEEQKSDELVMKLAKQQRKLAERQAKMEAQATRDKLIADFYATAKDEEKELADVLLAGVTEPDKVQKLLDLAKAKASKLAPSSDEEEEEKSVEEAFSAAPSVSPPEIIDKGKETAEKTRKGDPSAAWLEFLAAPAKRGPIEAE